MTSGNPRSLVKAASIITAAAVLSRILGYVREMLLAARFGATYTTDAYVTAHDLPYSLFLTVSAGVVMVFIPVYREVVQRRGHEAAGRLVVSVTNLTLLFALALLALGWALAPWFVPILVPWFPEPRPCPDGLAHPYHAADAALHGAGRCGHGGAQRPPPVHGPRLRRAGEQPAGGADPPGRVPDGPHPLGRLVRGGRGRARGP